MTVHSSFFVWEKRDFSCGCVCLFKEGIFVLASHSWFLHNINVQEQSSFSTGTFYIFTISFSNLTFYCLIYVILSQIGDKGDLPLVSLPKILNLVFIEEKNIFSFMIHQLNMIFSKLPVSLIKHTWHEKVKKKQTE